MLVPRTRSFTEHIFYLFYKCWTQLSNGNDLSIFYYMGKGQENNMFLSPVDDLEIIRIILNLKRKMSSHCNDINMIKRSK